MKLAPKLPALALLVASLLVGSVASAKGHSHDHSDDVTVHKTTHDGTEQVDQKKKATPTQQVAFLLMAIHELPPKTTFDKIPGARDILEKIALDHEALQQHRAVYALGYYPDAGTLQTYKALLKDKKTSEAVRHEILLAIGRLYQNDEGIEILKPYTKDKDPQIRVSAVYALSYMNSDKAFQVMKEMYKTEKDDFVLETLKERGYIIR